MRPSPVDGARNEAGEVWSSAKGGFVKPDGEGSVTSTAVPPKDGDVNARGEVWSSMSGGGYVGRKTYEQDMASRATLEEKAKQDLADMAGPTPMSPNCSARSRRHSARAKACGLSSTPGRN
ncbi:hypothetical protein MXD81_65280 [Microbacteriaceae bacterium K1510]|nr:hypothetical protein [Microbacteriaceae bacterium K1510]